MVRPFKIINRGPEGVDLRLLKRGFFSADSATHQLLSQNYRIKAIWRLLCLNKELILWFRSKWTIGPIHRYSEPLPSQFRAICFGICTPSLLNPLSPLKRKFQNKTRMKPRRQRLRISVYGPTWTITWIPALTLGTYYLLERRSCRGWTWPCPWPSWPRWPTSPWRSARSRPEDIVRVKIWIRYKNTRYINKEPEEGRPISPKVSIPH